MRINLLLLLLLLFRCNNHENCIYDIDGNRYTFVKIKNTYWLQQNLEVTRFQNGNEIDIITDSLRWYTSKVPSYSLYNNDKKNIMHYGILYNWYVASDIRNVCPVGWEVASRIDFNNLSEYYGGDIFSGDSLKDNSLGLWNKENSNNFYVSDFKAIPSGHRNNKNFERLGAYAFFWTKDNYLGTNCFPENMCAYECSINKDLSFFNQDWGHKNRGMSIRCVKKTN